MSDLIIGNASFGKGSDVCLHCLELKREKARLKGLIKDVWEVTVNEPLTATDIKIREIRPR